MFSLRSFVFGLAVLSTASATALVSRQTTNTNPAISSIVDTLDGTVRKAVVNIETLQATHKASDATVGTQISALSSGFSKAASSLLATPVSSGNTATSPTNDDISIVFADVLSLTSTGLSGLTTGIVPSVTSLFASLDPVVANATTALGTTLPGSLALVHTLLLDAQQFFVAEGFTQTLAALGF